MVTFILVPGDNQEKTFQKEEEDSKIIFITHITDSWLPPLFGRQPDPLYP